MNNMETCFQCGGYKSGAINMSCTIPMKVCCCNHTYNCSDNRQGWICSRCNKSISPDIKECDCVAINNEYVYWYPYIIQPLQPYIWYNLEVTCSTLIGNK